MSTVFNSRIRAKYDTYANWTANDPTPLSGELCVVVVPAESGAVVQEPALLIKVGDGVHPFSGLPFVSAIAADVHDWAKAAVKPTYSAAEIAGLADYISGEIEDTNTEYKLEQDGDNGHILKLYSKAVGGDWVLATTITTVDTVYDDTAITASITALQEAVDEAQEAADESLSAIDAGTAISVDSTVEGTATAPKIGVKISTDTDNSLIVGTDGGLMVTVPDGVDYTVSVDETSPEGFSKAYTFKQKGSAIATINIPKDLVVSGGEVVTKTEAGVWGAPDTYLALTLANSDDTVIYIRVSDLIDVYTAAAGATQIQLTISGANEISATIVAGSVGEDELSTEVKAVLAKAHTHENAAVLDAITAAKVAAWDASTDIAGLNQEADEYVIFYCGSSSEVI